MLKEVANFHEDVLDLLNAGESKYSGEDEKTGEEKE